MNQRTKETKTPRLAIEDVMLAVLGLAAGPLLVWMGNNWQATQAASSIQTLEYWIGLICGLIGLSLSMMWLVFFIAGLGFVVALKTKNKVIGYWSRLFTPKFLQRIIISVFGAQLALGSQAFAAPAEPSEPAPVTSTSPENPFMPEVAEFSTPANESPAPSDSESPTATTQHPSSEPDQESSRPSASSSPTVEPTPRQSSVITPDTSTTSTPTSDTTTEHTEPSPRQTTTIPVEPQLPSESSDEQTPRPNSDTGFTPDKPLPTPYVSAPNPDRITDAPTVVIKEGDCLWDVAHQELGADATLMQIDDRWRQWWQHNHEVIGDDPHTLLPGSVLTAPPWN